MKPCTWCWIDIRLWMMKSYEICQGKFNAINKPFIVLALFWAPLLGFGTSEDEPVLRVASSSVTPTEINRNVAVLIWLLSFITSRVWIPSRDWFRARHMTWYIFARQGAQTRDALPRGSQRTIPWQPMYYHMATNVLTRAAWHPDVAYSVQHVVTHLLRTKQNVHLSISIARKRVRQRQRVRGWK